MVELVDTRDLKSLDPKRSCGFESRSRHRLPKARNDAKRTSMSRSRHHSNGAGELPARCFIYEEKQTNDSRYEEK